MLLILVSGLLLLCMAGSAMAVSTATVLMPNAITINPDGSSVSSVNVDILVEDLGSVYPQAYTVEVGPTDGLQAYIGDSTSDDTSINVGSSGNWASSISFLNSPFKTTAASQHHTGKLYVKGTKEGTVTVYVYSGSALVGSRPISTESLDVSVPEFPTVAAPVAAILGLFFIIGRKKEGL